MKSAVHGALICVLIASPIPMGICALRCSLKVKKINVLQNNRPGTYGYIYLFQSTSPTDNN